MDKKKKTQGAGKGRKKKVVLDGYVTIIYAK